MNELVEKLYGSKADLSILNQSPFSFFNAYIPFLGSVKKHLKPGSDPEFFIDTIRRRSLPGISNLEVEEAYYEAMNRGVRAINDLVATHLPEYETVLQIAEPNTSSSLYHYLREAREHHITARNGRKKDEPNIEELFKAYDAVRTFGLGEIVLKIESSPSVINSCMYFNKVADWFDSVFRFRTPKEVNENDFSHSWKTDATINGNNIYVYGKQENPVRSRLKVLDRKNTPRYGSVLMKMFSKKIYPDDLRDYIGYEFVVEDREHQRAFVNFINSAVKGWGKLEDYTDSKRNENPNTAKDFDLVKFSIRPPLETGDARFPFIQVPVEVQVLTLEGHKRRMEGEAAHKNYKRRQFERVFPLFFPEIFYKARMEEHSNI